MKRFLMMLFSMFMSLQSAQAMNVDVFIDKNIAPYTDAIARIIFLPIPIMDTKVPIIILWILFAGIFFTIYFKGIAFWGIYDII